MPTGTGLDSQFGFKKETTYGTRAVPDKFFEFRSESLSLEKTFLMSGQLGALSTFQRSTRRAATVREGGGTITMEATNKGMGALFDLLHANAVTPVQQGGTAAYLQTHNIGTTSQTKSATIQIGRPSTDGTVRPFDYLGCMVTEYGFAWDVGDFLTYSMTFDAQEEQTNQTLATLSLPSSLGSFNFTQGALTIAGSNVADVGGGSITGGQPMKTDRFYLGATGLKAKPIQNAFATVSGTLNADFTDLTHYNRFTAGTIASVVLTFTGPLIAGAFSETIKLTMAACGFNGETPNVDGPDVLNQSIPFVAMYDGTNPPLKIEYTSVDTVI